MSVLQTTQETKVSFTQTQATNTASTTGPQILGATFTVSSTIRLKGIGWNRAFTTAKLAGIWASSSTALSTVILPVGSVPIAFNSPITLIPGVTYYVGAQIQSGENWSQSRVLGVAAPSMVTWGSAASISSAPFVKPTNLGTAGHLVGDLILDWEYSTFDTKDEPPEPLITAGPSQFQVTLPKDWMPSDLWEWDLQYAKSSDDTNFGSWIDVGTFPAVVLADDPLDTDSDPETSGTYVHVPTEQDIPRPFYTYRYRLRTKTKESNWSEIAYAGQLRYVADSATGVEPGAVGPGDLQPNTVLVGNIAALAITAGTIAANAVTVGTINAGAVTAGSLAANSVLAGNITANAIQVGNIDVGVITARELDADSVTSTKILANSVTAGKISVTNLQAVSTDMGTVSAGIFQTGTSGARVLMGQSISTSEGNKTGIVGIDGSNNVTFLIEPSTGDARFKGVLQPNSSGLGNVDGLTQNSMLMAGGNILGDNPNLDTTDVTPFTASNSTIARDVATYFTPPGSLKITASSTSAFGVIAGKTAGARITVTAAANYSFGINLLTTSSAYTINVLINWYTGAGAFISSSSASATSLADQWKRYKVENVTSPGTAASATVSISITGHANGAIVYADNFVFVKASTATGAVLIANSVTAAEISVGTLSAISADVGTITAGTITGTTVRTSASTARVEMNSTGLTAYDTGGNATFSIVAATGAATFTGTVTATSSVPSQALTGPLGGTNMLPNARFAYYTGVGGDPGVAFTDSPGYWQHYDNGGTGTSVWTKNAGSGSAQGPDGKVNSWRFVGTSITANKGFMTQALQTFKINTSYVFSFWAKGTVQPYIEANVAWNTDVVISNPVISSTVWQQYAWRKSSVAGFGGLTFPTATTFTDYFYISAGGSGSPDLSIAQPQLEEGEALTSHDVKADEVLPYTIGSTQITPNSITTSQLTATAIDGMTITGALIRTGSSGARVQMDGGSNAFDVYDSSNVNITRVDGTNGLSTVISTSSGGQGNRSLTWHESSLAGTVRAEIKPYLYSVATTLVNNAWAPTGGYSAVYATANADYAAGLSVSGGPTGNSASAQLYASPGLGGGTLTIGGDSNATTVLDGGSAGVQIKAGSGKSVSIYANGYSSYMGLTSYEVAISSGLNLSMNGNTVIDANGGWHRSYGATGFHFSTYGGGIYMTDSTYIRTYGSKWFYCDQPIWSASELLTSAGVRDPTQTNLYLRGGTTNNVVCQNGAGTNCDIWYATAHSSSDFRLKKNIESIHNPLQLAKRFRGVTHEWKKEIKGRKFGFIAQEIQQIAPELVSEGDDGYLSVDYEHVVPILVEAIKELSDRVETLSLSLA